MPGGQRNPAPAHQCSPPRPARRPAPAPPLFKGPLVATAAAAPCQCREPPAAGERAGPRPLRTHGGAVPTQRWRRVGGVTAQPLRMRHVIPQARALLRASAPHSRPRRKMAAAGRARRRWGGGGGGRSGARCLQPLASCPGKRHNRVAAARRAGGGGRGGQRRRAGGGGEAAQARGRHLRARPPRPPRSRRRAPAVHSPRLRVPRPLPAAP